MIFRVNFNEQFNLDLWKKQAQHYIAQMQKISYYFYLPNYRIKVEIVTPRDVNYHTVSILIEDIIYDSDGQITKAIAIDPMINSKFKDINIIKDLFTQASVSMFNSNSVDYTANKIYDLIKLLFKIEKLKVFV